MNTRSPFSLALVTLPLFQGMGKADLTSILGQTKFGFRKVAEGKPVVKEHDACTHLHFLQKGTLTVESVADDHGYRLTELLAAPAILQPEHLFGLHQHYTRTFTAKTSCQFITLDKMEVIRLMSDYEIFRLNLLNTLTAQTQKANRECWHIPPTTLEGHITRFIRRHCLTPDGEKTLHIKMTRLATELNDSRIDISHALNDMQRRGLLTLYRGRICIPQLEKL